MKVSFREVFQRAAAMSSYDGGLARRSRKTYWAWLKAFAKFTGKPAREWRAGMRSLALAARRWPMWRNRQGVLL